MTESYLNFNSRYALEACSSSNENMSSDSRASSSDNMAEISYSEVKATVTASKVKQLLDRRMKALEEEAEFSEQALQDSMEERKKLMDEIYMRLQFIRHSLSIENQETEHKSRQGPLIYNPCKVNGSVFFVLVYVTPSTIILWLIMSIICCNLSIVQTEGKNEDWSVTSSG